MKIFKLLLLLAIITKMPVYAQNSWNENETFIEAERNEKIQTMKSTLHIASNIKNVSVIINGENQGLAPITIKNLSSGIYHLKLEKKGYKSSYSVIKLLPYREEYYYIELSEEVNNDNMQEQLSPKT
ncbi:MAG: PEGA domain-containing protein [Treponema sp.]|nr:PEGA domain-containing protein [Treponema sp.]